MYIHIDIEQMHQLGLEGREMLVYSALLYLCRNAPWQGTIKELAEKSRCGNRDTTFRMLQSLQSRGLVQLTEQGYICTQNAYKHTQNAYENTQNACENTQNAYISEKESNQRKRVKENKEVSECENNTHTHTREILKDKFIKPNWKEWYGYGKEQGIDYLTCLKSFAYYESVGWAKISNWRATLIYWDLKDKTRR